MAERTVVCEAIAASNDDSNPVLAKRDVPTLLDGILLEHPLLRAVHVGHQIDDVLHGLLGRKWRNPVRLNEFNKAIDERLEVGREAEVL